MLRHLKWFCGGRLKERFSDVKFRRQHPVSLFIVDFCCHAAKLVIEIDGSIHDHEEVKNNDEVRQKILEELGLRVIRFKNREIKNKIESVLNTIEKNLK